MELPEWVAPEEPASEALVIAGRLPLAHAQHWVPPRSARLLAHQHSGRRTAPCATGLAAAAGLAARYAPHALSRLRRVLLDAARAIAPPSEQGQMERQAR